MSTRIENGSVIITPPNSEAPIKSQRIGIKKSSVCSYYLSGKIDEVLVAFNHLNGRFYLDLAATYNLCKPSLDLLLKNVSRLYRDNGLNIKKGMAYIKWLLENRPEECFSRINPPSFLSSKKYMKLDQGQEKLEAFKSICVGDLFQMVFAHPQNELFVLYACPRRDIGDALRSENDFKDWFAKNKIEL